MLSMILSYIISLDLKDMKYIATKYKSYEVLLKWKLATICNGGERFGWGVSCHTNIGIILDGKGGKELRGMILR